MDDRAFPFPRAVGLLLTLLCSCVKFALLASAQKYDSPLSMEFLVGPEQILSTVQKQEIPSAMVTSTTTADNTEDVQHDQENAIANETFAYLGPFVSSMHQGSADVLDALGGIDFLYLQFLDPEKERVLGLNQFFTDLNTIVEWNTTTADATGQVQLEYSHVDWESMASALGIGVQVSWYTWAMTTFEVKETGLYYVTCDDVGTFQIDDQSLVGDPYADPGAAGGGDSWVKWPLHLTAGLHVLKLKTQSRFRCQVSLANPKTKMYALRTAVSPSLGNPGLVDRIPHLMDGVLVSPYVSFPVVNSAHQATMDGLEVVVSNATIYFPREENATSAPRIIPPSLFTVRLLPTNAPPTANASLAWGLDGAYPTDTGKNMTRQDGGLRLLFGQGYPLPLHLSISEKLDCPAGSVMDVVFQFQASYKNQSTPFTGERTLQFVCHSWSTVSSYTFTFLDFDGTVQLATAKLPSKPCPVSGCGVLLAMHGAGVDAAWAEHFDARDNAWVLLPSNRDRFGYNWQGIGRVNALHTLHAFAQTLPGVPRNQRSMRRFPKKESPTEYEIDIRRVLFTGHSMGGHGCLLLFANYPDVSVGAACLAAWIRIDHYIQQFQSLGTSFADPLLLAIMQSAVAENQPDVVLGTAKGMPFHGRTGKNDESVHPWNLRRFVRMLQGINGHDFPHAANESEVDEGHWWTDVMREPILNHFFESQLDPTWQRPIPTDFRVEAMNLWGSGRAGVRILQLEKPFRKAWIRVRVNGTKWMLDTHNVRRFQLESNATRTPRVLLDGTYYDEETLSSVTCWFEVASKQWERCHPSWQDQERSFLNSGPPHQTFTGPVTIIYGTKQKSLTMFMEQQAVQLANAALVRGHAAYQLLSDAEAIQFPERLDRTNLVVLGGSNFNSWSQQYHDRMSFRSTCNLGENSTGELLINHRTVSGPGYGGLVFGSYDVSSASEDSATFFTRHLILMVGGTDWDGLQLAMSFVPTTSTAEIPEYLLVGPEYRWQGTGGIVTAGFWDHQWGYQNELGY